MSEIITASAVRFNALPTAHDGYTLLYEDNRVCQSDVKLSELVGDMSAYLTEEKANTLYQGKGDYLSASTSANFYPMTGNPSGFLTTEKDWTDTIKAASANAVNTTTAWVSANYYNIEEINDFLDEKYDTSSFEVISGTFLTAHQDLSSYYTKQETSAAGQLSAEFEKYMEIPIGLSADKQYGYTTSGWEEISAGSNLSAGTDLKIENDVVSVDTNGTTVGKYSFVEGENTYAGGLCDHVEGMGGIADNGGLNHIEGFQYHSYGGNGSSSFIGKNVVQFYRSTTIGTPAESISGDIYELVKAFKERFIVTCEYSNSVGYHYTQPNFFKPVLYKIIDVSLDENPLYFNVTLDGTIPEDANGGIYLLGPTTLCYITGNGGSLSSGQILQVFTFSGLGFPGNDLELIRIDNAFLQLGYSYTLPDESTVSYTKLLKFSNIEYDTTNRVYILTTEESIEIPEIAGGGWGCSIYVTNESYYGGNHKEGRDNSIFFGSYNHAEGAGNVIQYANNSHVEGESTKVLAGPSHAEGWGTYVNASYSHAEGFQTSAVGQASHSEGQGTIAVNYAHAEGQFTHAEGEDSHAEGYYTIAGSEAMHAGGKYNKTSANALFVIGNGTADDARSDAFIVYPDGSVSAQGKISANGVELGAGGGGASYIAGQGIKIENDTISINANECSVGEYAFAEGSWTNANGKYSHSEGYVTSAKKIASHAEGEYTLADAEGSHAEGKDTSAAGYASHAEGTYSIAYSSCSHAEGSNTKAKGQYSHAEGCWTSAIGDASHAEGFYTIAGSENMHVGGKYNKTSANALFVLGNGNYYSNIRSDAFIIYPDGSVSAAGKISADGVELGAGGGGGTTYNAGQGIKISNDNTISISSVGCSVTGSYAFAEGGNNSAHGLYSHAEGYQTWATGGYSHSEGMYTRASHNYAHAEGYQTTADSYADHAEGVKTKTNFSASHAEGSATSAINVAAHAEGAYTQATNECSHAEGYFTTAAGYYSHAEGAYTYATGYYTHAEGYGTTAEGSETHAEGEYTKAAGYYSHAEGYGTSATGSASHAAGICTHAENNYETVVGVCNLTGRTDNPLFVVGNGNWVHYPDSQRTYSDAFVVNKAGIASASNDIKASGISLIDLYNAFTALSSEFDTYKANHP